MTTRRESILSALASTLNGVAGATAYRSRVEPLSRNQSPAIIIEPISDTPDVPDVVGRINWRLTVRVSVYVRANAPDQAADPIVQSAYALMMADPTIGGRALDLKPTSVSFELVEADVPAGVISNDFEVIYQTSFSDMATL